MTKLTILAGRLKHVLLWSVAISYLFFSPSLYYQLFPREGKPVEILKSPPEVTGQITYNVEGLWYWSNNIVVYEENETYALAGWAFINTGPDTQQTDFERFIVLHDDAQAILFPVRDDPRRDVQKAFKDLGLSDLTSAGFNAVMSRNALPVGEYGVGLLFKNKQSGSVYYVESTKLIERTPNHLEFRSEEPSE